MSSLKNTLINSEAFQYIIYLVNRTKKMRFPSFPDQIHDSILRKNDYFRYATISLSIQRILNEDIKGSFAEVGVYRGEMSRIVHKLAPDRKYYLFDTFEGFPSQDIGNNKDTRFNETSVDAVLRNIGDNNNIVIRKGYVPETLKGLEENEFAFVLLDLDLYNPTVKSLEFFYPRLAKGGYLFIHDYNSKESDWACYKAVNEFISDKPERIIELADAWGTAMIRKI